MMRKLLQILLLTACCLLPTAVFAAISTVDSQGGAYSSIKLQTNGKPAVAYFDHKSGELRYSYWTGTQWIRTVVEEKGVTGYASLELRSDKPYISYYHNISKNGSTGTDISGQYGNHMVGTLKYAYCSSVPCLTPENWTKVTVTQLTQSNHEYAGGYSSLAFDSSNKPRIAYYDYSHKIDANDTMKGALKLAYCDAADCAVSANWSISTIDTDGGMSASMVIDTTGATPSNKVMISYDADEVQKVRYAEGSPPFSSWNKVDIGTIVNNSNLFRDTSIAIHPTTGKPRIVYQYQDQDNYGTGYLAGSSSTNRRFDTQSEYSGIMSRRDAYYAYCDAADCTNSANWLPPGRQVLASGAANNRGYTSSIKVGSDGIPRIAYHYWGYRQSGVYNFGSAYSVMLSQDLHYILCGNSACSSGNVIDTASFTSGNTGLYSSMILDSGNNPLISYYNYDSNQLMIYHPGANNDFTDPATVITANVTVSDTSNGGSGLQDGDTFKIIFSGSMNTALCSITTATIDTILKLSNGHSWVCTGSTITTQWSTTYNTNDTLTITVHPPAGGSCTPTVSVGDRISIDGTCIRDANGNFVILQTEIKGDAGVKIPSGVVAYYKMDEGSKLTAYDSAGAHNASLNNGVAWTTGISGSGLSLDGADDFLAVPIAPSELDNTPKITIEAWIKPNAFGTGYTVLSKENSYVMASNGQCAIQTPGASWPSLYGGGGIERWQRDSSGYKNIWRQVVCTYDSATGKQKVYIDGIYDGEATASGNVQASRYPFVMGRREASGGAVRNVGTYTASGACGSTVGYMNVYCGGYNYWGINYYNGKMDEVVLYNIALSQTEIENRFKEFSAQLERADANDSSGLGLGMQAGDTIAIRFTNETNAPAINAGNINTVLPLNNGHSWLDGNNQIGSAVWTQTRFTNDTLLVTLSTGTSSPTVAAGDLITLSGGVIKNKTGTSSITGSTTVRGSYDLKGAVAYWKFDESGTTNPSDSVGQYNNGTLKYTTTAPAYGTGKFGNALIFDGGTNSQYVEALNYPDLNPSNISVEAWVKLNSTGANSVVLSKNNQYLLRYTSANNKFSFYLHDGTDWEPSAHSTTSPSLNTWYHVVGTWDGTNQKIYVNGVLENTVTHNFTPASTTNALQIGQWNSGGYMNGSIDEVVIYNRAITDDEVRKRSSSRFKYAVAKDASGGGAGIQSGDKIIITFDTPTGATSITSANIGTALSLSSSHTWGTIQSAVWSTTSYTNDTLTITLSTTGGPTISVGDTITLGTTLLDTFDRALTGSIVIGGNFGDNFPSGRIAYYNFDEQGGTTAHDSIGTNHGALNNSFWKTERLFKGLYFDGSRFVDVPDSADFNLSSYTIDAWVKVPDGLTTGIRNIISQDDGTNYWRMRLNNNTLELCDSRLTTPCNNTATTINDGEWHHLAVVHDDVADTVKLYIDGVALVTNTSAAGGGTPHNITGNIQIGRKYDGTVYFYGLIDEIAVYNRALTAAEVQSRYRAPLKAAFTSDIYFNSGIQAGDKVIIRFHGKTNGYAINSGNIGTNLLLEPTTIDDFSTDTSASWTTNQITDSVSGGYYNAQITTTTDPFFYKSTSFSGANNTLEFIYKGYGANGPGTLTVYYIDGVNCTTYSATCSQSFALNKNTSWNTLTVTMTDAEWNSTDTITGIRFDFDGATAVGTMQVDSIKFSKSSSQTWGTIQSAVWSTYKFTNDTLTVTLGSPLGTLAGGDTITVNTTSGIKDVFGNNISDSITLSKDFDFNLPEGAISYYKLENNNDSFGTNNIASNTGVSGGCKFVNCYTYGASQYASVNNSYTLNPERITVEGWVNPGASVTTWAAGNAYFFYGANSVQFYGIAGSAAVCFSVYVNGAWANMVYTPVSISGWHHYVGTYDGANLRLYMDGAAVGTPVALTGVINQFDAGVFYLAQPATANNPSISIDDMAVYNRALTVAEVLGRYGDYTVTAIARDASGGGVGIQAGDTVTFKFSGPTNGAAISASNIDTALFLSNLHTWKNGSGAIGSAAWSSTQGYSNDTLTVTLSNISGGKPDVAPLDTVTIGSPIGAAYRAFAKNTKIGGLFGDNLPAGKIAYYNFDEQTDTTAYDSIGTNHGTLNNSFWRTERLFKGLYFDGSRFVDVPDSADFNLSSYTIDAWVKVPDGLTTGIRNIISQDDGTNYWRMRLNNNTLELCDSRLTTPCNNTATTINDGEWHHLTVVHDDVADTVKLYIDGVALVTNTSAVGGGTPHNITGNIQIGRKYDGTEYFYGMMDEIVVYNSALSSAQIQTRYRAPVKAAWTSDPYFNPGIQAGNDKVIIRFHGKTNVATAIDSTNINTILPITGKPTGWGTIQSAVWSTYPTGGTMTNNTLTITLGTGATIAKGDTITTNGTYIKDMYLNAISDSITLYGDFKLNLPEGVVSYYRFDETSGTNASDSFNGNSGALVNSSIWTTGKINNALYLAGPFTYTKLAAGTASAISTSTNYRLNGPQDGNGATVGTCTSTTSACYTWRASTAATNEWWKVDFGSSQSISRIKVYAYTTGTSSSYKVQTSPDNVTWTDRGSTTTNGWTTFDFSQITARYVRVYETANLGDGFLYVTEVEVYNDNSGNNYMQVNNSYSLNPERITVEAWAKSGAASWNVTDALVTKSTAYKLSSTSGSKNVSFSVYGGGAWRNVIFNADADGGFDITQWHHYAGTYDGANIKIYVDGVLKNTTPYTGVINVTDTTSLYIGSDNGATSYLIGNIDEAAIYNRALTAEEVFARYGDYSPITAFADDPAPDTLGIQAGDTVTIKFAGPTNGIPVDSSNIDTFLALSGLHTWKDGSNQITSAVWSTRVYENDTLTITLSAATSPPTVATQDTISIGGAGEIGSKYRAVTWSVKISGTFGEPLPGTPVAFWKMDENTGNIAFDSVGTNDGTLTNSPAWTTPAMFNSGINFNSNTTYMNVGSITLSGDWSIEGWFNYPLPATTGAMVGTTNLALGGTATASGTHSSFSVNGPKDGQGSTAGTCPGSCSTWAEASASTLAWWQVDLGSSKSINRVKVYATTTGTNAYYKAQLSADGSTWADMGSTTLQGWVTFDFSATAARYVRIQETQNTGNSYIYIREVEVYESMGYNSLVGDRRVIVQRLDMHLGTYNGAAFVDLDTPYVMSGLTSGWHHIAAVGDSSVAGCSPLPAGCTKFYIDGVLVGTANYKATAALTTVGNTTAGSEQFGLIDELAIYSSALTANDVAARYLVFFKEIYAKDTSRGGANIQNGDQVIVRFDGPTGATPIDATNINTAIQLSSGHSWLDGSGTIGSAVWSTTYKTNDTLTITLSTTTSAPTVAMRDTITLGGIITDFYGKTITGSMQIGGDFGTYLPDGAVGYWKFDETSGTTASDSFNDNNGTLTNTPTWTTGRFNNALTFTGGTGTDADYVVINNSSVLNPSRITVEAWVKSGVANWNTNGAIVSKRDAYILYPVSGTGNMMFYIYAGGGWRSVTFTNSGSVVDITGWHHYAGTYDGTNLKIYVDGVLKNTAAYTGTVNTADTGNLFIGMDDGTTNYLNGSIDEVVIYNTALSAADIKTRYGAWFSSAAADDNSNKGPNIQANDRVVIRFTGATNGPTINAGNINTILPVTGKTWLDGNGAIVSAVWTTTTYTNDTLTITLSGPAAYTNTTPAAPTIVAGDTININGTITDSSGRVIRDSVAITGSFGVTAATMSSAAADDNSGKGPNIQANDRVVITFSGATIAPAIDNLNINATLPVTGKNWLDGNGAIVSAVWSTTTNPNDTLTITLSGPATYLDTTPAKPTVVVGDTIIVNGSITDPTGKAIVTSAAITGSFGVTAATMSSAGASDSSGKGPNIQANDRVVITFSSATNAPAIDNLNINTILPLNNGHSWLDGGNNIVSASWNSPTNTILTIILSGPATYIDTIPTSPTVVVGDTITINGTITGSTGKAIVTSGAITGSFGVASTVIQNTAVADDNSGKGPNIQANDRVVITFSGTTNAPAINAGNINTILPVTGKTWLDGNGAIVSASWNSPTNTILTITLSGPATYDAPTPVSPTVIVGDTIAINGTITDSTGKAIISSKVITGSFGTASSVIPSSAVASDASNWGPNIQSGDRVVITFSGATNTPAIDATNIDTILKVNGKTWLDGNGAIGSAVWNSSSQLTITLSGPATQPDSTPARPTVVVGDTIIINGTITDSIGGLIIANSAITGSFGTASGTAISSIIAYDDNGKYGVNTGDKVVIQFNGQIGYTGDVPPTIDATNIDTVLSLNNGHSWKDGSGAIGGASWSTTTYANDTLTITLSSNTSAPTVASGDTITLGGGVIKDKYRTAIISSLAITGDFAIPSGMKVLWKFNETIGTTVSDSFGSYSGTVTNSGGSATTWTTGRFSNGLYVDGTATTGDYVALAGQYNLTSSWTIEAWFKWPLSNPITSQQKHTLISSLSTQNDDQIIIEEQTKYLGTSDGNAYYYVPNYSLKNLANGWHHVAAVGTGGIGTLGTTTFYIDGNSVGSVSYKSVDSIKFIGNSYMSGTFNRPIGNTIDNIVIYDTALSAATIKNRYGSWPRSAYAEGAAGEITGIQTGDKVVIRFDQGTEGNDINSNIGAALSLNNGHIWGSNAAAVWSTDTYTNDTLTITLSTTGTTPTVAKNDIITLTGVIKDLNGGRPISDTISLLGSFDFKLPSGAIAFWRFNEGSGTTVSDSFGSNTATASQNYLWADAMYGTKGVTIDASNEAVALNSAINMPTNWTIMGWIKTPVYGAMDNALIHGAATEHEHAICIHTGTGKAEVGNVSTLNAPGGSLERGTGYFLNTSLKAGWHHITAVGTGGDGLAGTTTYYVDGQPVGTPINYKAYTTIESLGNNTGAGAHAINTTIDEISVYDRALSATEIRQYYGARLKYARAKDTSGLKFGINAGDQVVIRFDGETNAPAINASNIDTVLKLSNGHTWKDGNAAIGSAAWSTTTYANDTLTITLSAGLLPPTVTTRDTITLDGTTIKELIYGRNIIGSIDISGDFDGSAAYYDLDDGADVTAVDSVNSNNGTLGGQASTLPTWTNGYYQGTALEFNDANSQYVTVPGNITVANSATTSGSAVVTTTNNFNTAGVKVGQKVTGTGIAVDAYVLSVDSNTQLTMSKNATASGTVTLSFISFDLTSYTIEAWIKLPTTIPSNNYMRIVSQESNTNPTNYWSLAINPDGQLVMCDILSTFPEININVASSTITNGSAVVTTTNNFNTAGVKKGQKIVSTVGGGIDVDTYVLSVDSSTQITMSKNAIASSTVTLNFSYNLGGLPNGQYPRCETVTTKTLNDNKWHFVSVVRDTGSGNFKFYIDHGNCASLPCVPDKTVISGAGSGAHNIVGTVEIGRKNGWTANLTSSEYFRGVIDNVAIYNYAMTDSEVNLHHFLYPTEAWAAGSSVGGINAGDSVTIVFNGETGATAINSGNIGSVLQLPAGKSWGTFNSASWSQTYYPNDTLKITLNADANIAVGDTIILGSTPPNQIFDVHNNPISGTIAITGSFDVNVPIGAIAYWDFDEGINSSIADKVGSYSGTIYNPAGDTDHAWVVGKFNYALEFPLNNKGYVSLPTAVPLTSDDWTIEAWFYAPLPTNSNTDNILINGSVNVTEQILSSDGILGTYSTADGLGFRTSGFSMSSLSTGWHHLIAVGKKQDNKTYFYIDGTLRGTANYQSQSSIARIGNGRYLSPEFQGPFGKIDDMVVYNRALSTAEIAARAAR